ncbi:hypothetical protein RO3G_03232 [Rhizopus delemar RA 99-880]|uniref:Uncharacterized protein n=1 Tax=Rhizopus delemar (strain RA 99-880 / ATCC MYA-4621 / FGSC 9543 / NRRL 43880) TaxID=246409 RepID=I1BQP8_RHIO9|nr:hypothetical protein RO3G_03232 [Rhizopus delemar RA 99-880]|eukprot:EIE78528.1 hypothetical protein RO3G_03232 [Rhizopus delemar RA 99-880]
MLMLEKGKKHGNLNEQIRRQIESSYVQMESLGEQKTKNIQQHHTQSRSREISHISFVYE